MDVDELRSLDLSIDLFTGTKECEEGHEVKSAHLTCPEFVFQLFYP